MPNSTFTNKLKTPNPAPNHRLNLRTQYAHWQCRIADPDNLDVESDRAFHLMAHFSEHGQTELSDGAQHAASLLVMYPILDRTTRAAIDRIKTAADLTEYLLLSAITTIYNGYPTFSEDHKAAMLAHDPAWIVYFKGIFAESAALDHAETQIPGLHQAAAMVTTLYDLPEQRHQALQQWLNEPNRTRSTTPVVLPAMPM